MEDVKRPTILITNDDGIDAPGLRALVHALASTNLYNVQVCAPNGCVLICSSSFLSAPLLIKKLANSVFFKCLIFFNLCTLSSSLICVELVAL